MLTLNIHNFFNTKLIKLFNIKKIHLNLSGNRCSSIQIMEKVAR